jgi:enoyl-CoA hydratase
LVAVSHSRLPAQDHKLKNGINGESAMADLIERNDSGGLCTLTLNRPEKLNALNTDSFIALDAQLSKLETQIDLIGCVVLRGAGASFCAGADLSTIEGGAAIVRPAFKLQVIERLERLPQPVIAAVHGHCFTGGLELALAADFIVSARSGRFADTHGKWGFVSGWGMSQRLPRRIGRSRAKRMMMTGQIVLAEEAMAIGLVDLCFADDAFEGSLAEFVAALLANSWFTNRATKRLMIETEGMPLHDGLAHEFYRHPGLAPDVKERREHFSGKTKS